MPGGTYTGPLGSGKQPEAFAARSGAVKWYTNTASANYISPRGTILKGLWFNGSAAGAIVVYDASTAAGTNIVYRNDFSAAVFFSFVCDVELENGLSVSISNVSRYGVWYI